MGKEDELQDIKFKGYDDRFSTYMWNSETREFFGRTGIAWAKLTIFYIIFYCGLACFAGLYYYLFSQTLPVDRPRWTLDKSLIGTNPGLGYRPMPDPDTNAESTLVWYKQGKSSDVEFWYKQLEHYIDGVDINNVDTKGEANVENCSYDNNLEANEKRCCRVDTNDFGAACSKQNKFGYEAGEPCILLKLNRIFGWKPQGFGLDDGQYKEQLLRKDLEETAMPEALKNDILYKLRTQHRSHESKFLSTIWISCEGETHTDKENIGPIAYYPQQGIPGYYFPYHNQKNYQSPFIFVQLKNPQRGVLINVECKAWAKNIIHDRVNRLGSVHFELLID